MKSLSIAVAATILIVVASASSAGIGGCWKDVGTASTCVRMIYGNQYAVSCRPGDWRTFELSSPRGPGQFTVSPLCMDPMKREPCDYEGRSGGQVQIAQPSRSEMIFKIDRPNGSSETLRMVRADENQCAAAFQGTRGTYDFGMMKSINDQDMQAEQQAAARKSEAEQMRNSRAVVKGSGPLSGEQVKQVCAQTIEAGLITGASMKFLNTVEYFPKVSSQEAFGAYAPKGDVIPTLLHITRRDNSNVRLKAYFQKDAFGQWTCH
ncbi:MAG: hypothetical protein JWM26_3445 [Betaproteobacteria bacterium]|nr:hypothetical protein [Betaproteobacteria bacterium]